jgi:hypothetical protein
MIDDVWECTNRSKKGIMTIQVLIDLDRRARTR